MKYFIHISYDGSQYHGWQYQPNVISVQEEIETALSNIFKQKTTAYGCGRTDTGVHASQYFFHIHTDHKLNFDLKFRLDKNLSTSIVVHDVLEMQQKQHARFDATLRTYDYYIHLENDAFLKKISTYCEEKHLNLSAMQEAARLLTNYTEFKSCCRKPHLHNTTICSVSDSRLIINKEENRLRFTITSNRFLRGMIRIIVFYLLKIGTEKMTVKDFQNLLEDKTQEEDKHLAFPDGLYLSKIEYPYLKAEPKSTFYNLLNFGLEV